MKRLKILIIFSFCLLTSCAGIQTYVDYDEEVDFQSYQTYSYYGEMETGLEELEENRLFQILDEALQDKGYSPSESADFYINFYSDRFQKTSQHNIGLSIGTIGRNVSGQVGSGIPINSTQNIQSITLEIVDASAQILVWQGIVEAKAPDHYAPEKKKAYLKKQIQKLLKQFPPQ